MTNHETISASVASLVSAIADESLAEIDFDAIRQALESSRQLSLSHEHARTELSLLRDDYIARIAGMAKALAVAKQNDGALEEAVALTEALSTMTAAQLLEQYRRTTSKFRDTFPASFGLVTRPRVQSTSRTRYSDHN